MDPTTILLLSLCLCFLPVATVWITMNFCLKTASEYAQRENSDFRVLIDRYQTLLQDATTATAMAKKNEERILSLIEATNLNTKSLALVETALNQLVLRQVGFTDKTRQTQVGEETVTKIGNRTVIGRPAPTTLTTDGKEGFVDETGTVVPTTPPTARELAATEPT